MGAVQLIWSGIIGEYIRLIFLETKGRPTYIVRDDRPPGESRRRRAEALPIESRADPSALLEISPHD
jgi:hypothetical protein